MRIQTPPDEALTGIESQADKNTHSPQDRCPDADRAAQEPRDHNGCQYGDVDPKQQECIAEEPQQGVNSSWGRKAGKSFG